MRHRRPRGGIGGAPASLSGGAYSYLVIVGEIKRFELKGLKPEANDGASQATGEVTR